jgi:D-alanine-D-alanine ligase
VRITVLTHVHEEGTRDWDKVVNQVARTLRKKKHQVSILGVHADAKRLIRGLERRKPDLIFNLLEEFGGDPGGNIAVCGLLDLLGLSYTGCGPGDYYLGQDKALAKKLLAFEGILYPRFAVFHQDKGFETGGNLKMPLFVKPVAMDSSIGIGKKSLVRDSTEMMQRVLAIHRLGDAALVEEYIEGREFYVGILGNNDAMALPPIELDYSGVPEGAPRVYGEKAKWDEGTKEYAAVKPRVAHDLPDELRARLHRVSLDAYRALRVRDYGRVDLRVADTGDIYVLEVNASCYLEEHDEFAMAARAAGLEYVDLIERIAQLARQRNKH